VYVLTWPTMQHQVPFCLKKPVKHALKMTKAMAVCVLHLRMVKNVRRAVHVLKVPKTVTMMANVAVLHRAAHVLKAPKMVTMMANAVALHHVARAQHAVTMHLPKNKALAYLPSCN
jgi:hypothetical protein